jgi:hypothetical protein
MAVDKNGTMYIAILGILLQRCQGLGFDQNMTVQ